MKRSILAAALALAAGAAAANPLVLAYYSGYSNNYNSLAKYAGMYTAVSLDYYNITAAGVVTGNGDPAPSNALAFLHSKKVPVYACISNVDTDWSPAIAHSVMTGYSSKAIANLVAFARNNRFAGINIDFEAVNQGDRSNFDTFAKALAGALHAKGLKLIISVPAFSATDEANPYNYAYDYRSLGASADYLQLMTYDENIPGWDPGPVAGSDWMENDLDYATSLVPPAKILNGIPSYGYDWQSDDSGSQLFWANTPALLAKYGIKPGYDGNSNSETFQYKAGGGSGLHTVWTENAKSVALKAGLVNAYGLGGTSMYALGMEDANFWAALKAGLAQ
ncbi:MAG TPA: glycosyl hydrolase family 18 protein [Burkholderiaceae bacterium]